MDNTKKKYSSFPFEWTVKLTFHQIRYRKAFDINEIDEIFCSIINAKGNQIEFSELANLLGFNLEDLAETDILNLYLKSITEYNLITISQEAIHLSQSGQEALQSKLKYKYFYASTELFENQTAIGENFDFSFNSVFDLENSLSHEREISKETIDNPELKQRLQFQIFGSDIYKGEIIELYENSPNISYKSITLQCETFALANSFQLSIYKSSGTKPELQFLIDLPENDEFKSQLIRKGMYHHILSEETSITVQDIETYIDLWNWKELAENPKVVWNDKNVFKLFLKNGDGSVWSTISEKAPIENIKSVIQEYAEYWNWTALTEKFNDEFIKEQVENFNWDFEELSYKNPQFVQDLLTQYRNKHIYFWKNQIQTDTINNEIIIELAKRNNYDVTQLTEEQKNELIELLTIESLRTDGWDWNYISINLSDDFLESHIDEFPWDYYSITEKKSSILRNLLAKGKSNNEYAKVLLSNPWNWRFISDKFDIKFIFNQISALAERVDWHTVLKRFFTNEEITAKCLNDESFKSLLKEHLPDNFVVAHQKYLWSLDLINFFEQQNLIQWETKSFIQGFDTNENVEWSNPIFYKYHNRITTESGFSNVSKQISDYSLIYEFPDFAWNWEGISQNKKLISNSTFIEKAFLGELSYSNNLLWNEILLQSTFDVSFWNKNLEAFNNTTESEKQAEFWKSLTRKEKSEYIFANKHFPWDWSFNTENSSAETILDSYEDDELFEKWDWKIATRKFDKETVLELLEDFAQCLDWKYLINNVFTIENELAIDKQLPKIAACLTVVESEKRKEIWKDLTAKIPFVRLFPIVESTNKLEVFEWDWNFISNHKFFPTDIATLNRFKHKINWTIFSKSNAIQQKYNPNSWINGKEWFDNTDSYLHTFEDYWDWQVLSKNDNINYNRFFLQKYRSENWDWEYLTKFGGFLTKQKRDKENYLEKVVGLFPKIKFEILSKRKDINIDSSLILSTKDKNWNWQVLSENERAEISNELILELKDKNWNWQALSKRKNIEFSNETLFQLFDKDWDWNYLSENANLEFNAEFIEKTKAKSWNWKLVSRHKSFSPSVEILTLIKDYDLDWQYISKHSSLSPTKEILAKFENKWHWQSITENPQINYDDIDFLGRFADKWNWRFICESKKLALNNQILNKFKEHLEWNLISSNTNVHFTKEIIQEFKQFWNWSNLKANKRVEELLGSYVTDEINKNATLNFLDKIEKQWSEWKGSIYHFSHIDNAVEIIKNRNIQSRNRAVKNSDSAGKGVIDLRHDAHDFARFYFRPHTPTQFYNEFLGKNTTDGYNSNQYGWVSWYDKARGLGFPKCPIPIFFKFSLKEILFKNEKKCRISNGNMQTSSTKFGSIEEMIYKFGFDDLYYTPQQYATKEDYNRYRNYAQQEFLVKDELAFDDLVDFEIVCPSEADRTLLKNLLGNEHKDVFSKIVVDRSYYNNENPRIRIEEEDSELHISTNFNGDGYFVLNGASDIKEMEILVGDVTKTSKDKIIFKSNISLGNVKQNIQLNFIDESNRSWFVYARGAINKNVKGSRDLKEWSNILAQIDYNPEEAISLLKMNGYKDVYSTKIRHYTLESHTILVCNVFEKYFSRVYNESISLELIRSLLILHDIGKTDAFTEGSKNNQYVHTQSIVKRLWTKLPYSDTDLSILLALFDGDYLGDYFQNRLNANIVTQYLKSLSNACGLSPIRFFKIYMIYYQCDIAAYTADEGGIKFLENLFEYKNGKKVFDKEEGILKMSPRYWEIYKQLKNVIENGN